MKNLLLVESNELNQANNQKEIQEVGTYLSFSYRVLTPTYREAAIKVLTQVFIKSNPLTVAYCQLKPQCREEVESATKAYFECLIQSELGGLSIVICDTANNDEVVGVLTGKDYFQKSDAYKLVQEEPFNKAEETLYSTMFQRLKPQIKYLLMQKGTVLQICDAALRQKFAGKSIFSKAYPIQFQLARKQGFKYAFIFTTCNITKLNCLKLGFEILQQIDSTELQMGEMRPFALIDEDNRVLTLMFKKLSA